MKNLLVNIMNRLSLKCIIFLITFGPLAFSQNTQTVRGVVVDKETQFPLIGVNVILNNNTENLKGTTTDIDGSFKIQDIPTGRHDLSFSYLGYEEVLIQDVVVNSGKESILNISMEESIVEMEEVVITARRNGEVANEMATVSAREFSVQETNRYAGSRGEPARMASNFAGVQGADDSRNDVVVRGNTPAGVLWRLDGINIPNPNHFSIPGTGGGSVTILNNKFLKNSDFFTGAFPAEFANGIAGVFDLKMRNGNNEKHERSAQLGFLGTELMVEGPLSKESKSSYLATYRYSSLQLFQGLGITVGTDAIPKYQDASFRINFPRKNGGNLAFFGIGGKSNIDILISDEEAPSTETLIYGSNDRDQFFGSQMATVGATYSQPLDEDSYFKATVAASHSSVDAVHEYVDREVVEGVFNVNETIPILNYDFSENKYSAYFNYVRKLSRKGSLKMGLNADLLSMNYQDEGRSINPAINGDTLSIDPWRKRWDASESAFLVQPYVQYKHRFTEKLSAVAGATALYFSINDKSLSPIEPRLGLSYQVDEKQKLGLGMGLHSQIQAPYLYYYGVTSDEQGNPIPTNKDNIELVKSFHAVGSYDRMLGSSSRLKAEVYFQHLYDLPIAADGSSFSLINAGSGFSRLFPGELKTGGQGRNYGMELTLERFFSKGYYFLFTGSVFDAKYKTDENVWRNTSFNGRYAFNGLFAKEWSIGERQTFNIGTKLTYVGGGWHGEVDEVKSALEQEVVYTDNTVNTIKFDPYFRTDVKLTYKLNTKSVTHEIGLDLVNLFNTKNILKKTYSPDHPDGPVVDEYQLGRLPLFYYRIDF